MSTMSKAAKSREFFRNNAPPKPPDLPKCFYLPTDRVPDETKNLIDSVCTFDTSKFLYMIGTIKIILLVPLLVIGVMLVSINSTELRQSQLHEDMAAEITVTAFTEDPRYPKRTEIGNESYTPIWTGVLLTISTAMDFIAACHRRSKTIIMQILMSTLTFVASILCVEYDRLAMNPSPQNQKFHGSLRYRLYFACVVVSSISAVVSVVSIFVGSRMGALEESRLYLKREGKDAILLKKERIEWLYPIHCLAKALGLRNECSKCGAKLVNSDSECTCVAKTQNAEETIELSEYNEGTKQPALYAKVSTEVARSAPDSDGQ